MLSLVCSCEDEKIQQPEFVLETPEISISAEGGNYEILYSIKNPSEDGKVLPETACQWISELDASLGLEFSIFPADKEMTYIGMLNEKSYIDQFATDEEYFADDMSFF